MKAKSFESATPQEKPIIVLDKENPAPSEKTKEAVSERPLAFKFDLVATVGS